MKEFFVSIKMNKNFKYLIVFMLLFSLIASTCKTRKDCGGRRKRKIKTQMGGYM